MSDRWSWESLSSDRQQRAAQLYDLVVASPEGLKGSEMMALLACNKWQLDKAIFDVRRVFAADEINLVADPGKVREEWTYQLVGNLDGSRWWVTNRVGDVEIRVATVVAILGSIHNAVDGRTLDGRKINLYMRHLGRLMEDLAQLTEGEVDL